MSWSPLASGRRMVVPAQASVQTPFSKRNVPCPAAVVVSRYRAHRATQPAAPSRWAAVWAARWWAGGGVGPVEGGGEHPEVVVGGSGVGGEAARDDVGARQREQRLVAGAAGARTCRLPRRPRPSRRAPTGRARSGCRGPSSGRCRCPPSRPRRPRRHPPRRGRSPATPARPRPAARTRIRGVVAAAPGEAVDVPGLAGGDVAGVRLADPYAVTGGLRAQLARPRPPGLR